jgi:hypothetical protein
MSAPQQEQWLAAMPAEPEQLAAHETYHLESTLEGIKIIPPCGYMP